MELGINIVWFVANTLWESIGSNNTANIKADKRLILKV
jgi:hypothetical protein